MTTTSLNNPEEIKKKFQDLLVEKNESDGIKHDALILMSGYLSEIDRVSKENNIRRNKLAQMIKTSASYLTQVFRGDKPLNFETIAKIQRKLKIRFAVKAHYQEDFINDVSEYKPLRESYSSIPLYYLNYPSIGNIKTTYNSTTKN
jgi:ribosome-binding protein aMBF1 (putative translation factor)